MAPITRAIILSILGTMAVSIMASPAISNGVGLGAFTGCTIEIGLIEGLGGDVHNDDVVLRRETAQLSALRAKRLELGEEARRDAAYALARSRAVEAQAAAVKRLSEIWKAEHDLYWRMRARYNNRCALEPR